MLIEIKIFVLFCKKVLLKKSCRFTYDDKYAVWTSQNANIIMRLSQRFCLKCGLSCSLTISVVCSTLTVRSIFTLLQVCQETLLVSFLFRAENLSCLCCLFHHFISTLNFFSHPIKGRVCWHNGQSIKLHTTECGNNSRMKRTKQKTTVYGPLASFLSLLKFYYSKLYCRMENVLLLLHTLHVRSHDGQHRDNNL